MSTTVNEFHPEYFASIRRSGIGRSLFAKGAPAAILVLLAALLLGGGTRPGFLSDAILQLLSVPILLATFVSWRPYEPGSPGRGSARFAFLFCFALLLMPLAQLIPLPPAVWTRLPGREVVVESFGLIGRELPWMPLSVAPQATWLGLLSFLPTFAVLFAAMQVGYDGRRALSVVVIAFGAVSVIMGLMQVAQGQNSGLRLFEVTNVTEAVGFFANRNHFAALLYAALLLAVPWAASASTDVATSWAGKRMETKVAVTALAFFTVVVMLISAQAMARSRAAMGLTVLAILAAFLIPRTTGQRDGPITGRVMLSGLLVALIFAGQLALYRVMERFDTDPLADSRIPFGRNTIEAALSYMPFGSGVGSFVPVYGMFEKLGDLSGSYANRAHNDILEAWLESGVIGIVLFAIFIGWFLLRTARVWFGRALRCSQVDSQLARAATIVIALLLAHSLADYPLRTGAMAAVFALCCALMIPPPNARYAETRHVEAEAEPEPEVRRPRTRRMNSQGMTLPELPGAHGGAAAPDPAQQPYFPQQVGEASPAWPSSPPPGPFGADPVPAWPGAAAMPDQTEPFKAGEKWGKDVVWPEEWRSNPATTDKKK